MERRIGTAAVVVASAALILSGCSSAGSAGADENTLTVVFKTGEEPDAMTAFFTQVKEDFETAHEGVTVELVPIKASDADYITKVALMNRSANTAPDIIYEDTFRVRADAAAGYLEPLDGYVAEWEDWDQFYDNAKNAGQGDDGKTYSIQLGTDTQGIWYNTEIFEQAGIPVPWQPTNWAELLETAETIKAEVPDVTPINLFSGKAAGEAATMRGMLMLLYGTELGENALYNNETGKWVVGSQGFIDALQVIHDVFQGDLGLPPEITSDPNYPVTTENQLMPEGTLAIAVNGSWLSGGWKQNWPEWSDVMAQAAMPTQDGQGQGMVTMSGGWSLAMGALSDNKDAAWDFLSMALDKEHALEFDATNTQIAVRSDVAQDPAYTAADPTLEFFSSIVEYTHYRPSTTEYPEVSNAIQEAMEAVMTGTATPEEAARAYDEAVVGIVGEDNTEAK